MGNKKKKKKASTTATATNTSNTNTTNNNAVLDCLQLQWALAPIVNAKTTTFQPFTVVLTPNDAAQLDVEPTECVILLSQQQQQHIAMAIATVVTTANNPKMNTTPRSVNNNAKSKTKGLSDGYVQISSQSVFDILTFGRHPCNPNIPDTIKNTINTNNDNTPTTPTTEFSFRSFATPQSPTRQPQHPNAPKVWIVPVDSNWGDRIRKQCTADASHLTLRCTTTTTNNNNNNNNNTNHHRMAALIRAYHQQQWVQPNQSLDISYQGQSVQVQVVQAVAKDDDEKDLVDALDQQLHLNPTDPQQVWAAVLGQSLSSSSSVQFPKLYRLTRDTSITIVTNHDDDDDINMNDDNNQHKKRSTMTMKPLVAGMDAVVDKVMKTIQWALKNHDDSTLSENTTTTSRMIQPPRGILLYGPTGVGKTALARQIIMANDNNNNNYNKVSVEYLHCLEIVTQTSIVGQAEGRLQQLFSKRHNNNDTTANKKRLLILDDIHLICPKRGGTNNNNTKTDQVASTLLALLDGATAVHSDVFLMGITNQPSQLDPALRRPGRLDVEMEMPIPDSATARADILSLHAQRLVQDCKTTTISIEPPLSRDDWNEMGKLAKGFNGADCMLAIKEALRSAVLASDAATADVVVVVTRNDIQSAIQSIKPSVIQSVTVEIPKVHWTDIGGMDKVKRELKDAIEFPMAKSQLFQSLNIPPPRGILLYGPPGCSKTLMARALATEGQMNFLAVKGPELLSKWLGESERALASLFKRARMASPSIIFFDEIDAIASKRGNGDSSTSSRLLSQLLTELDGITASANPKTRVVVVAATNRPDLLDSALIRPGRIDKMIYVGVPDAASRFKIFEITLKGKECSEDVDLTVLASDAITKGFSGAECVGICRDAALLALEEGETLGDDRETKIGMTHLIAATNGAQRQITPDLLEFYATYETH